MIQTLQRAAARLLSVIGITLILFTGCSKEHKPEAEKSRIFADGGKKLFAMHYKRHPETRATVLDSAIFVLEEAIRLDPGNTEAHYFLAEAISRRNFKADQVYSSQYKTELNYFALRTAANHYLKAYQEEGGYTGDGNVLWPWEKLSTEWGNVALAYLVNGDSTKAIATLREATDFGGFDAAFLEFSRNYLISCPDSAILFTNADMDTYGLLYLQLVEGYRPDVLLVNLSLLNMDRYIKWQRKVGLPLPLSDTQIDSLQPNVLAIGRVVYIYDKIIRIVEATAKRPICFTVNVSPQTLSDYDNRLALEGLVYRLENSPSIGMDTQLNLKLFKEMGFDHLPREMGIPGNGSLDRIAINDGTLGIQLGSALLSQGNLAGAVEVADILTGKLPWTWPTDAFSASIYAAANRPEDVEKLWKQSYEREPENAEMIALFVSHFQRMGMQSRAEQILTKALRSSKSDSLRIELRELVGDIVDR